MKFSRKGEHIEQSKNLVFGINFHDFLEKERTESSYELANEFGLSYNDIYKLKKQLKKL